MKWEPLVAMLALLLLGLWLVSGPGRYLGVPEVRPGAQTVELRVGPTRGIVEIHRESPDAEPTYRLLFRNGVASDILSDDTFRTRFGDDVTDEMLSAGSNWVFRLFNITSWGSLVWIAIGLGGQLAFFGRMAIQWIISEKERRSVVPPLFWYLSLAGGIALFLYFVWRQDAVGVLGQTTGVVIYARNIRLIYKQRRREKRKLAAETAAAPIVHPPDQPTPETPPDPHRTDQQGTSHV